jgi:copper resistance protein D
MLDLVLIASRFTHFGASMLVFGAACFPFYAGIQTRFPTRAVTVLSLVSGLVWFACVLEEVSADTAAAFNVDQILLVLSHTSFGFTWALHLALAAGLIAASLLQAPIAIALLAFLNLVSLTGIGHAAAGEGLEHLGHLVSHGIHLIAGGIWLGGLIPLWQVIKHADEVLRRSIVKRFSAVGIGAVVLVALTGLFNVRAITGGFIPDWSSDYGRLLLLKALLFGALLLMALFNQLHSTRHSRWTLLRQGISAELIGFIAILLVVGLLGVTSPMS